MTDSLTKNLGFVEKYNPSLVRKLNEIDEIKKNYDIVQNTNGEYNLGIDGIAVHSLESAQAEAKAVFSSLAHNTNNSVHVLFGLGLGYLLDEFSQNSLGSVILFEPDLETLRLVFEAVDLSDSLQKRNVFIVSDFIEFENVFESVFRYKSEVSLSFLDYYKNHCANNFESFKTELFRLFQIYSFNFKFQTEEIFNFLKSTITSLEKKYSLPLLSDNKDKFKNIPAIIVSAGPSLGKNIDVIKKHSDKALIFCVGTALKTLCKKGITPDFLNVIEKYDTSLHFDVPCTKDMVLISEPFTHEVVHDIEFKKRLLSVSLETDPNRWFLEKGQKELVDFETKGTVSYQSLFSAFYMGCNPIILLGQDLAYTDGKCYAKGSEFEGLVCMKDETSGEYKILPENFEEFRDKYYSTHDVSDELKSYYLECKLETLNKSLTLVDSQDGGKLPTESGYALFIEYFNDFAKKYGDCVKLINSSIGGAKLEGFETTPLETVLASLPELADKSALIDSLKSESSFDIETVVKSLKEDVFAIEKVKPLFEKGIQRVKHTLNYYRRAGNGVDSNVIDALSKAVDVYVEITNEHTNPNRLLKTIVFKENSILSHFLRESSSNLNDDAARYLYQYLYDYFHIGLDKSAKICEDLKLTIKKLEERI